MYEVFDLYRHEKGRVGCLCKFPQSKEIALLTIVGYYNGRLVPNNIVLDPLLKLTPNYSHWICINYALISWLK